MLYDKNCSSCNEPFSTNRKEKLYCSNKCRLRGYKKRLWEKTKETRESKICISCKIEFRPDFYNTKYCNTCKDTMYKEQTKIWIEENPEQYMSKKKVYQNKISTKIKKKDDFLSLNNSTKEESIANGVYNTHYTTEDDLFLLNNWDKMTKKELAIFASLYDVVKVLSLTYK